MSNEIKPNILFIDDDRDLLRVVSLILNESGFNVTTASNGKEGIEKFDSGYFDIVITDIQMPGIYGNEVAKHIRSSYKNFTPIIGISGGLLEVKESGFDLIISKPFTSNNLIVSVKNCLQHLTKAVR